MALSIAGESKIISAMIARESFSSINELWNRLAKVYKGEMISVVAKALRTLKGKGVEDVEYDGKYWNLSIVDNYGSVQLQRLKGLKTKVRSVLHDMVLQPTLF